MDSTVINKVGTSQIAILARNILGFLILLLVYRIKNAKSADNVEIEYRDPDELLVVNGIRNTEQRCKESTLLLI